MKFTDRQAETLICFYMIIRTISLVLQATGYQHSAGPQRPLSEIAHAISIELSE